mgnify:FL=1|tara:strand:+ start:705 stop:1016 length:312 start_codon:yes stop_codon:yes gene_type:complete
MVDNNYEFGYEESNDKIWCFKNDKWFETILLAKLSDNIKTPYCVVSEEDVGNYFNGSGDISIELYKSCDISLIDPSDNIDSEFVINVEEGIKILEEHGYKVIK